VESTRDLAADPHALADVANGDDALVMGAAIFRALAEAARSDGAELHLSVAGGRKTMSAHALMAFSLLGRERDRASHVLVDPPEAEFGSFWHPDQGGDIEIRRRGGSLARMPVSELKVALVDIPAPIMRDVVGEGGALDELDFEAAVRRLALARDFARTPQVVLVTGANLVRVGSIECRLGVSEFTLFAAICLARREDWPGVGPDGYGPDQSGWLSWRRIALGRTRDGTPLIERLLALRTAAFAASGRTQSDAAIKLATTLRDKVCSVLRAGPAAGTQAYELQGDVQNHFGPELSNLRRKLRRAFGIRIAAALLHDSKETAAAFLPVYSEQ